MDEILAFFEKAITIPEMIESKAAEVRRLKELACSLSAVDTGEKVQASKNVDCKYAELINKAVDLEAEILDDTQAMLDHQREVGRVIDKLPRPTWRLIMRDLYLDGLTVKEVARKRGYSERQIYNLRGHALKECGEFHLISFDNVI